MHFRFPSWKAHICICMEERDIIETPGWFLQWWHLACHVHIAKNGKLQDLRNTVKGVFSILGKQFQGLQKTSWQRLKVMFKPPKWHASFLGSSWSSFDWSFQSGVPASQQNNFFNSKGAQCCKCDDLHPSLVKIQFFQRFHGWLSRCKSPTNHLWSPQKRVMTG